MVDNCICDLMCPGTACTMRYHYQPAVNEYEFNQMALVCDPILIKRREKAASMEIVNHRNMLLRQLSDLRYKPYRTIEEDRRMGELGTEVRMLMMQIGRKEK